MEDFSLDIVARKSAKGVFALVSRTFLVQLLSIVASLILAVFLSPAAFGIFFIVSAIVTFFNYFADIGLAASLIQKKEEPTLTEFRTVFTFQQVLVLCIIIPAFFVSGYVQHNFKIGHDGVFLYYAFLISFLLSSLKTIPTIILERKLDFHKLVIPQIAENLAYNLCLIVFAINGFGINSFTIAIFSRAVVGLVAMYLISPWKIGFAMDRKILRNLLSFGLPFQLNSFLALAKDDLIDVYLGKILPLTQVGYIGFAQKWAYMPLRLIMDNVVKVIFPSFSRLQHDKDSLKIVIEKSLFLISTFMFPITVGFIMLSGNFINFIPRYHKWEPAVLALSFFALDALFGSLSAPITNFLSAVGKVKIVLYFMASLTTLMWVSTPIFIHFFGFNGMPAASFLVALCSAGIYFIARRYVAFSFVRPLAKPFLTSLVMAAFIFLTKNLITSLPILVVESFASIFIYFAILFFLTRSEMKKAFALFLGR